MILHSRFVRLIRNTFGSAAQKTPLSGSSDGSRINAILLYTHFRDTETVEFRRHRSLAISARGLFALLFAYYHLATPRKIVCCSAGRFPAPSLAQLLFEFSENLLQSSL